MQIFLHLFLSIFKSAPVSLPYLQHPLLRRALSLQVVAAFVLCAAVVAAVPRHLLNSMSE
jgi:hypothetical protein